MNRPMMYFFNVHIDVYEPDNSANELVEYLKGFHNRVVSNIIKRELDIEFRRTLVRLKEKHVDDRIIYINYSCTPDFYENGRPIRYEFYRYKGDIADVLIFINVYPILGYLDREGGEL